MRERVCERVKADSLSAPVVVRRRRRRRLTAAAVVSMADGENRHVNVAAAVAPGRSMLVKQVARLEDEVAYWRTRATRAEADAADARATSQRHETRARELAFDVSRLEDEVAYLSADVTRLLDNRHNEVGENEDGGAAVDVSSAAVPRAAVVVVDDSDDDDEPSELDRFLALHFDERKDVHSFKDVDMAMLERMRTLAKAEREGSRGKHYVCINAELQRRRRRAVPAAAAAAH